MDERAIAEAAALLMAVRKGGHLLESLPPSCRPATIAEGNAVQNAVISGLGDDCPRQRP